MAADTVVEAGDDLVPAYTEDEDRQLAERLFRLHCEIERGDHLSHRFDVEYLCELHRQLFDGIRSHAGQLRRPGQGSEHKVFGPNRSVHRDSVEVELRRCFETTRRCIASVDDNPDDPERDASSLHIAVWTHAEVIRIHPFEDGNGRTSRLLLDSILVRLGLLPVPIEEAKQAYCDCLNHYFESRELQPLLDMYLRLYVDMLAAAGR